MKQKLFSRPSSDNFLVHAGTCTQQDGMSPKNKIQFFRILLLTVLSTVMLNGCKKSNDTYFNNFGQL